MENDDARKDFNAKSILKIRKLLAPILKAVLVEYEDVSVEEIAEKYLPKAGQEVELLNSEKVDVNEIPTSYDIHFVAKTPDKFGYDLVIDLEVQVSDQGLALVIRKIVYMAKLFTNQKYKLDEIKEKEKEEEKKIDFYRNLDHPVLLSLEWIKKKGRGNKIIHTELNPVMVEYSDGLIGKIEEVGQVKTLPSELKAFALERFIAIYVDLDVKNPTGIFKYLSEGIFNWTDPESERLRVIEEFTGSLGKEDVKMLEDEWGTKEYFEKRARENGEKIGEKRARKETRKEDVTTFMKILKKQGMSEEEAQQALQEEGLVFE